LLALVACLLSTGGAARGEPPGAAKAPAEPALVRRIDGGGDPLPAGAVARLGTLRLQHGGRVTNVLYTRDGKGLISAGGEPAIHLWDPATGQEVRSFAGHEAPVCSVALSPDGRVLASGGEDQTVRLWDVATGRELRRWPVAEDARAQVAFSASGKVLASGGKEGSIVFWDVDTGKEIRQLKGRDRGRQNGWGQPVGPLTALAFTPDGRHLLTALPDGLVMWDLATGKRERFYESYSRGMWGAGRGGFTVTSVDLRKAVSFSADGQTFVLPGSDGPVSLWEVNSLEDRGRLEGSENAVLAARFAPDGKTLVSASIDGAVRIWDAGTLKELQKIDTGNDLVCDLAVSPDGKTAALGTPRGRIRLFDLKTGKEQNAGPRLEPAAAVGFTADGLGVVTLDARSVRRWDAATGKELRQTPLGEEKEGAILRLSADRRLVAQARPGQPVRLLDATTGKEVRALEGTPGQVFQLALAPDGKTVAAATMEGDPDTGGATCTVRLWDATTGRELRQLPGRPAPVAALAVSPDGRTVAAAEAEGEFRLWELATGRQRRRLGAPSRPGLNEQELMEMRMVMRVRGQPQEEGSEPAGLLVFTPDGKGLAVGEGEIIRVWDLASGKVVRRFAYDAALRGEFAFSPDGRLLAAGGGDNAVWVWNSASTEVLARLTGHRGPVHRLAFSADGKALVSASADGTALVWDVAAAVAAFRSRPRGGAGEARLAALWADLADPDAARAYGAILELAEAPGPAVRLLRERLRPAAAAEPRRVARLIADLDNPEFSVRQAATDELEQLHELAAPALAKALASEPPPETRRRLEGLLRHVQRRQLPADTVRALRAVEVLEAVGTGDARQQLEALAGGVPDACLTKEAKAALERLSKRPAAKP
jgi:WD40 repeat protein